MEDENRRLKKMYAEERLISEVRKEALEGVARGEEGAGGSVFIVSTRVTGLIESISQRMPTRCYNSLDSQ